MTALPVALHQALEKILGITPTRTHALGGGMINQTARVETPDGLVAALHNGRGPAAEYLADRGARLNLEAAAGAGRLDAVRSFFTTDGRLAAEATQAQMESGFIWACNYGQTAVVDFLLQRGIDVGVMPHGETGLHCAAYTAHPDTVRLLLQHKAPVNTKDKRYGGTPLGWALYGWREPPLEARRDAYYEVVALLVRAGATVEMEWLTDPVHGTIDAQISADRWMLAALRGEDA